MYSSPNKRRYIEPDLNSSQRDKTAGEKRGMGIRETGKISEKRDHQIPPPSCGLYMGGGAFGQPIHLTSDAIKY